MPLSAASDKTRLSEVRYRIGIQDQPTISLDVAASFFGWSRNKFDARFRECLHQYIDHIQTKRGLRLVLVDVIRCAFRDIPEDTLYKIAVDYVIEYGTDGKIFRMRREEAREEARRRGNK